MLDINNGHYFVSAGVGPNAAEMAGETAQLWSQELNMKVTYSNPKEPIFVIEKKGKQWHVIIGEKIGWIVAEEFLEIQPLVVNNGK
jgi:hypothetical protein